MTVDPLIEHLHNQLLAAIFANVARDLPDAGVAPWVSANDKPTVISKPVSGDAAEQRLKTEVMQLPARDRRRLKEVPDVSSGWPEKIQESRRCIIVFIKEAPDNAILNLMYVRAFQIDLPDPQLVAMSEYHMAKQFRNSDAIPTSAGGLNKTSISHQRSSPQTLLLD